MSENFNKKNYKHENSQVQQKQQLQEETITLRAKEINDQGKDLTSQRRGPEAKLQIFEEKVLLLQKRAISKLFTTMKTNFGNPLIQLLHEKSLVIGSHPSYFGNQRGIFKGDFQVSCHAKLKICENFHRPNSLEPHHNRHPLNYCTWTQNFYAYLCIQYKLLS